MTTGSWNFQKATFSGPRETEYVRADRIEELEAKLAKAVEALEGVDKFVRDLSPFADPSHSPATALARACEVYAELTGGSDA